MTIILAMLSTALLAGCGNQESSAPPAGVTEAHAPDRPDPVEDGRIVEGEDVLAESDTTSSTSRRRTPVTVETARAEMETTTTSTSTTSPPDPTEVRHDGDCDGPQALRVRVAGSDGTNVTAQISADFKRNGQKIDVSGQPIPDDRYSQTTFINTTDGTDEVCFPMVPDAEVYLEVYPKDYVDGAYTHRSSRYGSVMWHGVWAGPGQAVSLRLPVACGTEQPTGRTGTINVSTTVDGEEATMPRLVAWSRAEGSTKVTPGFAVADASHYGTPEVKRIETVAAEQDYLVQVQTTDHKTVAVEPVRVAACNETNIDVNISGRRCTAKVDGAAAKRCAVLTKPVG